MEKAVKETMFSVKDREWWWGESKGGEKSRIYTWGYVWRSIAQGRQDFRELTWQTVTYTLSTVIHKSLFRDWNANFQLLSASIGTASRPVKSLRWKTTRRLKKIIFLLFKLFNNASDFSVNHNTAFNKSGQKKKKKKKGRRRRKIPLSIHIWTCWIFFFF